MLRKLTVVSLLCAAAPLAAQTVKPFDAAAAFGARDSVTHLTLAPDGMSVAYITPAAGQGSVVYTLGLAKGSAARPVLNAGGNPERIERCDWVSNQRLVSQGIADPAKLGIVGWSYGGYAALQSAVLLFHGALDSNVDIAQSKRMAASLASAGVHQELVTWDNLDHYLDDSAARTEMLRKSDAFLRQTMGLPATASTQ
jgi:hypothetical protein